MNDAAHSAWSGGVAAAALLAAVAVACTLIISAANSVTRERIAVNERNFRLALLNELVPSSSYDNDFLGDSIQVSDAGLLGTDAAVPVYRASAGGEPVAAVIMSVAPNGYTGPVQLAVAIRANGTLAGVRATRHRETAGLGDAIDSGKSDWIFQFSGRSLTDPDAAGWRLAKDGGRFDAISGASITSRAVVQAVRDTLLYFDAHRAEVFSGISE